MMVEFLSFGKIPGHLGNSFNLKGHVNNLTGIGDGITTIVTF